MYALLFAGGFGQRLWPISRKNSPKQFTPLMGDKSSLQLAVERLADLFPPKNIFISTNKKYAALVQAQCPEVPEENFILEPTRRDLAAAVALSFFKLYARGLRGPILFQWSDNYIQNTDNLLKAIEVGRTLINERADRIVFLGETPRFPSENLGWIEQGEKLGQVDSTPYYAFRSWHYRPKREQCVEMLESGRYVWNPGYFVTTIEFVVAQFRKLAPEISPIVEEIVSYEGTAQAEEKLDSLYQTIPAMHFDEAFLERLGPDHAILLKTDLKWSDPGSLYALKEALQTSTEANVTQGKVVEVKTCDSLIINEEPSKVVAIMGLEGIMVVNTADALLVISKDAVRYMASLLTKLEEAGHAEVL